MFIIEQEAENSAKTELVKHPKNWGTPVTPESFAIWKAKFDEEMKVGEKVKSTKPTGKELFEKNGKSILENEDASRFFMFSFIDSH